MGATPITRVLSGDPFRIMKALGAGTQGVIVPVVAVLVVLVVVYIIARRWLM